MTDTESKTRRLSNETVVPETLLLMNKGYVLKEAAAQGRKKRERHSPYHQSGQMDRKRQEEAED